MLRAVRLNMVLRWLPRRVTATMIASAISETSRPYSTAEAPRSECMRPSRRICRYWMSSFMACLPLCLGLDPPVGSLTTSLGPGSVVRYGLNRPFAPTQSDYAYLPLCLPTVGGLNARCPANHVLIMARFAASSLSLSREICAFRVDSLTKCVLRSPEARECGDPAGDRSASAGYGLVLVSRRESACSRYHSTVLAMPSRRPIFDIQPDFASFVTSSSFCGVPSGLEVSHVVRPLKPTVSATTSAIALIVASLPVPTLTCSAPS